MVFFDNILGFLLLKNGTLATEKREFGGRKTGIWPLKTGTLDFEKRGLVQNDLLVRKSTFKLALKPALVIHQSEERYVCIDTPICLISAKILTYKVDESILDNKFFCARNRILSK